MTSSFTPKDKYFLYCGIATSILYIAMNIFIPMMWSRYDLLYHTVSELSAVDAPTRSLWIQFGFIYAVLMIAFGVGVVKVAKNQLTLRIAGYLLFTYASLSLYWPPMHQREVLAAGGGTLTDTLHLWWAGISVLLMFLAISFGAAAHGKKFRIFSFVTMALLFVFGLLTSLDAPNVAKNLPTPWIGLWERINTGAFLLWICILSITIMHGKKFDTK